MAYGTNDGVGIALNQSLDINGADTIVGLSNLVAFLSKQEPSEDIACKTRPGEVLDPPGNDKNRRECRTTRAYHYSADLCNGSHRSACRIAQDYQNRRVYWLLRGLTLVKKTQANSPNLAT